MISQRNRPATYDDLTVLYGLGFTGLRSPGSAGVRSPADRARLGSSSEFYESCRFADLSARLTCFFVGRTDRGSKATFKVVEKPLRRFTLVSRVYGSHDPDSADLRGHHDDLHGSAVPLARRVVSRHR